MKARKKAQVGKPRSPVRVDLLLNERQVDAIPVRAVLDADSPLADNLVWHIAPKFGVTLSNPLLFTERGSIISEINDVRDGELLYLEPDGKQFIGVTSRLDSVEVSSTADVHVKAREEEREDNASETGSLSIVVEDIAGKVVDPPALVIQRTSVDPPKLKVRNSCEISD